MFGYKPLSGAFLKPPALPVVADFSGTNQQYLLQSSLLSATFAIAGQANPDRVDASMVEHRALAFVDLPNHPIV